VLVKNETVSLRETLTFLVQSDMPAHYKRILIEVVTQALYDKETKERSDEENGVVEEWRQPEVDILAAFLQDKLARSWQHADELVLRLARELRRDPDDVRRKAIELGFGLGVDYRLAKERVVAGD
jgi:hypothetical protein